MPCQDYFYRKYSKYQSFIPVLNIFRALSHKTIHFCIRVFEHRLLVINVKYLQATLIREGYYSINSTVWK